MPAIALVTCKRLPEPDPDQEPLLTACFEAGLQVELAAWDDPQVDWSRFHAAVLRSCWNYYEAPDAFRLWLEMARAATRLWNPPEMVHNNLDKRYLACLALQGIPIVPTRFLGPGAELLEVVESCGWNRFVVKPTVSAGSFMTRCFTIDQASEANRFVSEIQETRCAMVQPYMESVDLGGEVSLIHIDGELTHCVAKEPRFSGHDEAVSKPFQPDAAQADAARRVMETVTEPWLYARVDLMKSSSGLWLLSELELIEPSLFLLQHRPALIRFVRAIGRL